MQLSVIIPTHNRAEVLKTCLTKLSVQKGVHFEVIVVDDGSTDRTDETVAKLEKGLKNPAWSAFTYIKQPASHQGVARNRGVKKASGDIVVFIGDDIFVETGFLKTHHDAHKKHPEKNKVVLGLTTWDSAVKINDYMRFLEQSGWQFDYHSLKPGPIKKPEPYKYFYTSNLSLKRSFFHKERFDEKFRHYGWEDIEMGYRLWKNQGMEMIYEPHAFAYHHHHIPSSDLPKKMRNVGASAVHFEKLQPEVQVIPKGLKRILIALATNPITLPLMCLFGKNTYYKLRSWREFFKGVKQATS